MGNDWTSLVGMAGMLIAGAGVFYTLKGSVEANILQIKELLGKHDREIESLQKADIEHTRLANQNQQEIINKMSEISTGVALLKKDMEYLKAKS